jgi:predicted permease
MKTEGLVVFGLNPQTTHSNAEAIAFYNQLLARLRTVPGVRGATAMENRIGSGWSNNNGAPPIDGAKPATGGLARSNTVGADFFHTLGVPILAGRDFTDADNASAPPAVIVNETFVKTYMPNRSPLGHQVGEGKGTAVIVGLVKDNKYTSITENPIPMMWVPYMQMPGGVGEMHVELRVATQPGGNPLAILAAVRRVVAEMDPNLPLQQPMTQRAQFEESISQQQLFARLAGFFGLIAVVLVATGLYGTMAYRVNNRTMEIGVRMALGAKRGQVVWMIVRESLTLAAIGVALGVPMVLLVSHLLSSQLFGVKPYDGITYVAAALGVAVVAMAATLVPAQRAASVDPVRALRSE